MNTVLAGLLILVALATPEGRALLGVALLAAWYAVVGVVLAAPLVVVALYW